MWRGFGFLLRPYILVFRFDARSIVIFLARVRVAVTRKRRRAFELSRCLLIRVGNVSYISLRAQAVPIAIFLAIVGEIRTRGRVSSKTVVIASRRSYAIPDHGYWRKA